MKKSINITFPLILLGIFLLMIMSSGFAKNYDTDFSNSFFKQNADRETRTLSNAGNWSYWIQYDGLSGYDPVSSIAGGTYPRGTATLIFQDGVVWGAFVQDTSAQNPRVGGQTYNIGTSAGAIITPGVAPFGASRAVAELASEVQLYRINVDYTVPFDQLTEQQQNNALKVLRQDAAEVNSIGVSAVSDQQVIDVVNQYAADYANWPADKGAPTYPDGTPGIAGADQVIWFVVNDLDIGRTSSLYGSNPMGIECQITIWSYNQPTTQLGQVIYKQYKIINKSGVEMDSMYVAQWSDPDVGEAGDDFAGCDTTRSIGYAYNGYLQDRTYELVGLPPPSGGYDFFQGPLVAGKAGQDLNKNGIPDNEDFGIFNLKRVGPGFINLPMTNFIYFAAGSPISDPPLRDYEGTIEWYKMLNGYIPNNDDPTDNVRYTAGFGPTRGEDTKYPLAGNPFTETGDIDGRGDNFPPGDRRIALCSGPFVMQPGDTQEVTVAVVGGIIEQTGGNNRNAVEQMKLNDDYAQIIFDSLFSAIPKPQPSPAVSYYTEPGAIQFEWGSDLEAVKATEETEILGFKFEGYNIYQLPTASSTKAAAKLIQTYDVVDNVTTIRAPLFLPEFKDVVTVPVQFGTDNGITRYFTATKDYINDKVLDAGNEYYFAITAYNYNPNFPNPTLESPLNVITVTPQGPVPGTKYETQVGEVQMGDHVSGISDGIVEAIVVDPAQITGDQYEVYFTQDTTGTTFWNLRNVTTGTVILTDQPVLANVGDSNTQPFVDGFQVKVSGPPVGINTTYPGPYGDDPAENGWNWEGTRWISGTDGGGVTFFGGLFNGVDFFGSTITPTEYVNVNMEWASATDRSDLSAEGLAAASQTEEPDRWSKAVVYRRDLGYAVQPTLGMVPFALYDTSVDPPRRLKIAFVEDANDGSGNLLWDMGWNGEAFASLGGREYTFLLDDTYDEDYTDYLNGTKDGTYDGVLYAIWPSARGSHPYLEADFEMQVIASKVITLEDKYTIQFPKTEQSTALAKQDVEKINVFPNPYYAYNPSEKNRFDRFVTFNHMPRKATVRIFNLGGVQVRKMEKNSDSQFFQWDLKNEHNLPVASGLYVAYIDMPDLGKTKTLKVMIIQGQQILESY